MFSVWRAVAKRPDRHTRPAAQLVTVRLGLGLSSKHRRRARAAHAAKVRSDDVRRANPPLAHAQTLSLGALSRVDDAETLMTASRQPRGSRSMSPCRRTRVARSGAAGLGAFGCARRAGRRRARPFRLRGGEPASRGGVWRSTTVAIWLRPPSTNKSPSPMAGHARLPGSASPSRMRRRRRSGRARALAAVEHVAGDRRGRCGVGR